MDTCIGCDRAFTDDETVGTPWGTFEIDGKDIPLCFDCYCQAYWGGVPERWKMVLS